MDSVILGTYICFNFPSKIFLSAPLILPRQVILLTVERDGLGLSRTFIPVPDEFEHGNRIGGDR